MFYNVCCSLVGRLLYAAQCVWCWWDPWCTKSDWVTKHLTDVDNLLKYMEVMWCRSLMIIMGVNYGSFFNGMWGSFLALHFTLSLMSTALICLSTKSLSKGTWPWRWLRLQCQIANWFALFRAQHSTAQYSMDEYSNHGVMMILSGQGVFFLCFRICIRICICLFVFLYFCICILMHRMNIPIRE